MIELVVSKERGNNDLITTKKETLQECNVGTCKQGKGEIQQFLVHSWQLLNQASMSHRTVPKFC